MSVLIRRFDGEEDEPITWNEFGELPMDFNYSYYSYWKWSTGKSGDWAGQPCYF